MLEPIQNPNAVFAVDPPRILRWLMSKVLGRVASTDHIEKKRRDFEAQRVAQKQAHTVEYFHQLDDPYSHLMAQVLAQLAERYDIKVVPRLIRATGGKHQPEDKKLAAWARRDAALVAPHYGLTFPDTAGMKPELESLLGATRALANCDPAVFIAKIKIISEALWSGAGDLEAMSDGGIATDAAASAALDAGSARLLELKHYSGASLYYGGEWYWGVDRLFHLEQRLRDLGACHCPSEPYLVPRPEVDVTGVDASQLALHFYPSLNSPYSAIIFDRTVALAKACDIRFHHKPVLPMIMRGVAATTAKGRYIFFDTKREADYFGVPFGHHVTPIGAPTRQAYSLLPWAKSLNQDAALMSALLRLAFSEGKGLHLEKNLQLGVETAGLDWQAAKKHLGSDNWKPLVEQYQTEMVEGMGLWGVPSYRLTGPDDEPDLEVWGQDRLWLIAAEIRRRAGRDSAPLS
ncbi:MAG: DsbA family protein [Pseudomonadales bacterium]|nr:DsbA family protein [Pseudomonadales bacterium]